MVDEMTATLCSVCGALSNGPQCPRHRGRNETARSSRRGTSGYARQAANAAILEAYGHACYKCGGLATEVDHIVAKGLGGSNDASNLAAICTGCHGPKSAADNAEIRRRRALESDGW